MTRKDLLELVSKVKPANAEMAKKALARLDNLTKPPGSLGYLEEIAWRLAAIQGKEKPSIGKKRVYTLAGDHGVTEEGVSPYPKEVTPQMVLNFLSGGAAINVFSRHVGAEVKVVDVGVAYDFPPETPNLIMKKVRPGTANFAKGPAMTEEEALKALKVGLDLADEAAKDGVSLLGVGEMGIGNTTPSAALLSVFTGLAPEDAVGRGTGSDEAGMARKAAAIRKGISVNAPNSADPLDVLTKLGGLEIAGMTGVFLGAAVNGIPVLADGFISGAAALTAVKMCPFVGDYLFLSHLSEERGHKMLVEALGQRPIFDLGLRLGEGTGAALSMSLVEAAAKMLSEMATFAEAGVSNRED